MKARKNMKNEENMSNIEKCRHIDVDLAAKRLKCRLSGEYVDEKSCENCCMFASRYIEYPITVSGIDRGDWNINDGLYKDLVGSLVKIRPCAEEYHNNTYIGIFLGEIPCGPSISYNNETERLNVMPDMNPAILVPELRKIFFGCESWWSRIEKDNIDTDITDEMIASQPYMQLLREMMYKEE